jgi:hypothetical protein
MKAYDRSNKGYDD